MVSFKVHALGQHGWKAFKMLCEMDLGNDLRLTNKLFSFSAENNSVRWLKAPWASNWAPSVDCFLYFPLQVS